MTEMKKGWGEIERLQILKHGKDAPFLTPLGNMRCFYWPKTLYYSITIKGIV